MIDQQQAELERLREAARNACDATDKARKQYGGTISFEAAIKLDALAALLEKESNDE